MVMIEVVKYLYIIKIIGLIKWKRKLELICIVVILITDYYESSIQMSKQFKNIQFSVFGFD